MNTDRKLEAMLKVSQTICRHQNFEMLLKELGTTLHDLVNYDLIDLLTYDAATGEGVVYYPGYLDEEFSEKNCAVFPFVDGPSLWVWENQRPLSKKIEDYEREYPRLLPLRREQGIRSSCTVPLTTVHRQVGTLEFLSRSPGTYDDAEETLFIQFVADQVAIAVDNALIYQQIKASEAHLARERDHLRALLDVTNAAFSQHDMNDLIREISLQVHAVLGAEFCGLILRTPNAGSVHWEALNLVGGRFSRKVGQESFAPGVVISQCLADGRPCHMGMERMDELSPHSELVVFLRREGIRSFCALPLSFHRQPLGLLIVGQRSAGAFDGDSRQLLGEIALQVSMAVSNILAYRDIVRLQERLNSEKLYLEEEIKSCYDFGGIVGQSERMRSVFKQIEAVAKTDSTVLILGETGTGKELMARAIYESGSRKAHPLVKVNCSAIPATLLESELFGHEKGAFTGAVQKKIGRFEMAHMGTIFLDEVADLPLELQPKLLRVLQEQEFERLGGTRSIHVDVRIMAATNRNLPRMVAEGRFRSDLYYRLNIFPIVVPPLRERREDIPLLVCYFVEKYAKKMKRAITTIPEDAMERLTHMDWPGNVRELEHVIERAVVMSNGPILQMPLDVFTNFLPIATGAMPLQPVFREAAPAPEPFPDGDTTLEAMERRYILRALQATGGVVGGAGGAADRLGLKRTTLLAKMKRLGIVRSRSDFLVVSADGPDGG